MNIEPREGNTVISQRQVRISATAIAATLALSAVLTLGGAAGYAVRADTGTGYARAARARTGSC